MNNVCKLHRCYYFYFGGKGEFGTMAKIPVTKKFYIYYKLFGVFLTFWGRLDS